MRSTPRTRREIPRPVFWALRPGLRYSVTRDAYVVRGVGNRVGPVLRPRREHTAGGGTVVR